MPLTSEQIIEILQLQPHPGEGGYFRETYRSVESLNRAALPARYKGPKHFSTAIYYLITAASFSKLHRLGSDEMFHFYVGSSVELVEIEADGGTRLTVLGTNLAAGERPQHLVPRGVWQGLRLSSGGSYALLGTTVAPGFDYEDFELGERDSLLQKFPQLAPLIRAYT